MSKKQMDSKRARISDVVSGGGSLEGLLFTPRQSLGILVSAKLNLADVAELVIRLSSALAGAHAEGRHSTRNSASFAPKIPAGLVRVRPVLNYTLKTNRCVRGWMPGAFGHIF